MIHTVESDTYQEEMCSLQQSKPVSKKSSLLNLNPVLDEHGILRFERRLKHAKVPASEKHPVSIPKNNRHYHDQVQHQGCQFTEGAVR